MNTLTSTAAGIGDRFAAGEIVWEWVCEMDPPPNGIEADEWLSRVEGRYDVLMEQTDLLKLPPDLVERFGPPAYEPDYELMAGLNGYRRNRW